MTAGEPDKCRTRCGLQLFPLMLDSSVRQGASGRRCRPGRPTTGGAGVSFVTDYLVQRGLAFESIPHARAFTSIEEARALGIDADEVVKTIALSTASGHVLAVIPASRRLDMRMVRRAVGDNQARLATEDELQLGFAACELGALPPLGSLLHAPTYVDPEIMQHDMVVFATGSQTESAKARAQELFDGEQVTIVPLTPRPEQASEQPIAT
jgi:Ala-tRNA(Pro) deacylase